MMKLFAQASDKLASKLVGSVDAGACYPRDYCYCSGGYKYYTNCLGNCVKSTTRC